MNILLNISPLEICLILYLIISIILSIILIATERFNKKSIKIVQNNSLLLKKLKDLNSKYTFNSIDSEYTYANNCKSKLNFERTDINNNFLIIVKQSIVYFEALLNKTEQNQQMFKSYEKDFQELSHTSFPFDKRLKITEKKFRQIENKFYFSYKLKPTLKFSIKIEKYYISPQGKNKYYDFKIYTYEDVIKVLLLAKKQLNEEHAYQATKQYQRSLMTDSLRYEILKRDNFRCQICGASAQDGAKLHVDHIKPIAKGGLTVKQNLRTLCEICNLGKRDKYDEHNLN